MVYCLPEMDALVGRSTGQLWRSGQFSFLGYSGYVYVCNWRIGEFSKLYPGDLCGVLYVCYTSTFSKFVICFKKKKRKEKKPNYIAKPLFVRFFKVKVKSHWFLPGKLVILFKARNHQLYKESVQIDLHLYFQSNLLPLPTMNFMFPLFCRLVVPWIFTSMCLCH